MMLEVFFIVFAGVVVIVLSCPSSGLFLSLPGILMTNVSLSEKSFENIIEMTKVYSTKVGYSLMRFIIIFVPFQMINIEIFPRKKKTVMSPIFYQFKVK